MIWIINYFPNSVPQVLWTKIKKKGKKNAFRLIRVFQKRFVYFIDIQCPGEIYQKSPLWWTLELWRILFTPVKVLRNNHFSRSFYSPPRWHFIKLTKEIISHSGHNFFYLSQNPCPLGNRNFRSLPGTELGGLG